MPYFVVAGTIHVVCLLVLSPQLSDRLVLVVPRCLGPFEVGRPLAVRITTDCRREIADLPTLLIVSQRGLIQVSRGPIVLHVASSSSSMLHLFAPISPSRRH